MTSDPHSAGLAAGYAAALAGFLVAARLRRSTWPRPSPPPIARPWRELAFLLVAVVATLAVGQLYQRDLLLPRAGADARNLGRAALEAANQLLIFSPLLLLIAWRGRPFRRHAWLPMDRLPERLAVGALLACLAAAAFLAVRGDPERLGQLGRFVARPTRIHVAVQVLLEDVAIALAFVRLAALTGRPRVTAIAIGALFAAGHVPALLADGAGAGELVPLLRDAALASAVLLVLRRGADVWWFACVHTVLDLTQYFPRT